MSKLKILDLFCGAGGASQGYFNAGFDVVGVDIVPQKRYPFQFIQANALKLDPAFIASFDAVHASPPCQSYSTLAKRNGNGHKWPRLIRPVRALLTAAAIPYVIENVAGAPLRKPITLCGTMFEGLRVVRHRVFETNFSTPAPPPHRKHPIVHSYDKRTLHYGKTDMMIDFVQVTGTGNYALAAGSDAMGISWMTKKELNESIPPAYTEWIGRILLGRLETR